MADAMCGPSNPLQQFRKQTQLDRSLQQDRLSARSSASQGFRSKEAFPGALDADFEAFQNGLPPAELGQRSPFLAPPPFAPNAESAWASDFHRLAITPPAIPNQQHLQQSVLNAPSSAGWAADFRTHVAQTPRAHSAAPSPQIFQQRARFGQFGTYQPHDAQTSYFPMVQSKGKEPVVQGFDDAAFDQAFDQARQDLMSDETMESVAQDQEIIRESLPAEAQRQFDSALDKADLAAQEFSRQEESLRQEEAKAQIHKDHDDDALAATASELLEKVQHNQTDKFKNSQFLGLMRKLRDREVKVEGDKMVETTDHASISGNEATLRPVDSTRPPQSQPPIQPRMHSFDNSEQRPSPLVGQPMYGPVDTRRRERSNTTPFDPSTDYADGQGVLDLLANPGAPADVPDSDADFYMSSPYEGR